MQDELLLDPKIRDWVLLPIVIVMILVGIGRSYAQILMANTSTSNKSSSPNLLQNNNSENDILKHKNVLTRAAKCRLNASYISHQSFHQRKKYFNDKGSGILRQKFEAIQPNPLQNTNQMQEMLKGNMSMMIPNVAMMGLVSYFFSGFVLVKVPFPLTPGFRSMLQRGVELSTLDVAYVSSLSWYFLVMFGLRAFYSIILGDANVPDDARMMQAQMGAGTGGPQAFDAGKLYQQERESLELVEHKYVLENVEYKLLGKKQQSLV